MYAHSPDRSSRSRWHRLDDHVESVSRLTEQFATPLKMPELGAAVGLLHDAGKCFTDWQKRLLVVGGTRQRIGIPHADVGANLAHRVAGPAALTILGHHTGLTRASDLDDIPVDQKQADRIADATRHFLAAVPRAASIINGPSLIPDTWNTDPWHRDIGLRLLFSALVDADWLDTSAYKTGAELHELIRPDLDAANLIDHFDHVRSTTRHEPTATNLLRGELFDQAIAGASRDSGMYRLTLPTGLGKTLTSTGFALHHAAQHGHRRIIMAVPFITITRQNATVLREHLGDETVLEQHSAVELPDHSWMKLATENWDAPFIVTTTVQLFQSLFARTPGRVRKLHRIARSVIILDEVQALPATMLVPILNGLRVLVEHFDCTVVLCSATQPTFDTLPVWKDLDIAEVVPEPKRAFARARTVRYRYWLDPRPTWEAVAWDAAGHDQSLLIVNTRKDARALHQACLAAADGHTVLHISRDMCEQHILDTFDTAKQLLGKEKLLLISTQLIEAGVDIDFPAVYRAWATAEAHLQSAGRCDREGGNGNGLVTIFDPAEGHQPSDYYATASSVARRHFGPTARRPAMPDDLDALASYYSELHHKLGLVGAKFPNNQSMWQDWHHITHNRERLNFRDVAQGPHAFRMINDDTVPIVVTSYTSSKRTTSAADVAAALDSLSQPAKLDPADIRAALRTLQPYMVSLRKELLPQLEAGGALNVVLDGALYKWMGQYDQQTGLRL